MFRPDNLHFTAELLLSLLSYFVFLCLPQSPPPHLLSGNVKLLGTAALIIERDPPPGGSSRTQRFLPVSCSACRLLRAGKLPTDVLPNIRAAAPACSLSSPTTLQRCGRRSTRGLPAPCPSTLLAAASCPPQPRHLHPSLRYWERHPPAGGVGGAPWWFPIPAGSYGPGPTAPGSPARTHLAGRRHLAAPPVT